jgi:hypothetical protein
MYREHLREREKIGDVGAVNSPFVFSTRDLQQRMKSQSWIKHGDGTKAIEAALLNLEKWFWIYIDGDKWMPREDLLERRW